MYDPVDNDEIAAIGTVEAVPAGGDHPQAIFYSWVANADVGGAGPNTKTMRSVDGGKTFSAPRDAESSYYAMTRLPDGDILDVAFIPTAVAADGRTVTMRVTRSEDNGATWSDQASTFVLPQESVMNRGIRVNPNVLVDDNGNLYISYYTTYKGKSGNQAEIAVSKDQGKTWSRKGQIIWPTETLQYNEVGLSWTPDGEMMAVVTQDETNWEGWRRTNKLITARSSDNGATWTGHRVLPIERDPGYEYRVAPDGKTRYGILPDLEVLENGTMVLRYGRPDNWFAISTDGGQTFEQARRTYVNYPTTRTDGGKPFAFHGSSGNGNVTVIGPNKVLISGDNCAALYGCPDHEGGWQTNGEYSVWMREVTVTPPS